MRFVGFSIDDLHDERIFDGVCALFEHCRDVEELHPDGIGEGSAEAAGFGEHPD